MIRLVSLLFVSFWCVSCFVCVIAFAADMCARDGGGARVVSCAIVSCKAVSALRGVAAVEVFVMKCVLVCDRCRVCVFVSYHVCVDARPCAVTGSRTP